MAGSWKWRKNYDLFIFQVLRTGAFLRPEMNSLGRYMGCFDILFVSERSGWSGRRTWKMNKMYQKYRILESLAYLTSTAHICGKIAPHPYVSYIFRILWISSFILCCLNLLYFWKITHKFHFLKKCRFSQIITILGLFPIANEGISRFCAFRSNFLYDFI